MIVAKVLIKRKGEESKPEDLTGAKPGTDIKTAEFADLVIQEGGCASGKTSVAFHVILEDGTHAIAQTSAAMFETMAGALRGAELRFAERK